MGDGDYLCCCSGAHVKISSCMALICLIINCMSGGIGTIISGVIDARGINCTAIFVGIVQILTVWFAFGYIWGIIHMF